jgi:hypothetical protein
MSALQGGYGWNARALKRRQVLIDYSEISLADARREYLASITTAMPIGGVIAWSSLAIAAYFLGTQLPSYVPLVAAAALVPIALAIDMARGELGYWKLGQKNPLNQLFLRFITVVGLIIPFVILAAQEARNLDLLILGLAILAGMIWVPHGWGLMILPGSSISQSEQFFVISHIFSSPKRSEVSP